MNETSSELRAAIKALDGLELVEPDHQATVGSSTGEAADEFNYPRPIPPEGFRGIAGRLVSLVEGHTEADSNFLLLSFLTYAGNVLGRKAFVQVGGDRHYSNLFICAVGPTSGGRKGSATGPIEMFFEAVDPEWVRNIQSGLSSGEGLIWCVRDAVFKKEKGIEACIDSGINDKRLLVRQSEFFAALQAMKRQGNTLSATIRDAWDRGNLNVLTKNSPARATGAHISIVANITREELLRGLASDEMDNGFSNRFLWACSRRSKALPEGGRLQDVRNSAEFGRLVSDFHRIRDLTEGSVLRDGDAGDIWGRNINPTVGLYAELTRDRRGLFGLCTARAAAMVLRLGLIYALLDGSSEVRREHQDAAYATWRYCEDSAKFIFGDSTGDPVGDRILESLKVSPAGLSRKEISALFAGNRSRADISRALEALQKARRAFTTQIETKGRPLEQWFAGTGVQE